jgi:Exonuclease VII small subunit
MQRQKNGNNKIIITQNKDMKKKEISYNDAIAEIEAIVEKIGNSDLNIDELNKDVERAIELISFCKTKLHTTEENINKILEKIVS